MKTGLPQNYTIRSLLTLKPAPHALLLRRFQTMEIQPGTSKFPSGKKRIEGNLGAA
jgi:hypothetical protein